MRSAALFVLAALTPAAGLAAQTSSADYTKPYQRQALEIFRRIIAVRSAETHGKVPEVANYLA
ncbi:MAG: hypothetical protein R2882_15125, partial [Gemmatimonadales bacterium]